MKNPISVLHKIANYHDHVLKSYPLGNVEICVSRHFGCMVHHTSQSILENKERKILKTLGAASFKDLIKNESKQADEEYGNIEVNPKNKVKKKLAKELASLLDELENSVSSYVYCLITHKGGMKDWAVRIDTHHTIGHCQYFPLVREKANNLNDLIEKTVKAIKESQFCKMSVTDIPEKTDTKVKCFFKEWDDRTLYN